MPAPDGPISTTTSPRITSSDTSSSTLRPPRVQVAPRTETTGALDESATTLIVDSFAFMGDLIPAVEEPGRRDARRGVAA